MEAYTGLAFLQLESIYNDIKTLPSGHKIYLVPEQNRGNSVTVTGIVFSDDTGLGIEKGDKVAFSYQVVANYTLGNDNITTYHNQYLIDGDLLWKARKDQLFAVYRNGRWDALGDWVLMNEVKIFPDLGVGDLSNEERQAIGLFVKEEIKQDCGIYHSGSVDASIGDILYFDSGYRSIYDISGETFIVLRKQRILSKS